ncbi:Membrane protein [Giardia muris]|uniref:Membrane protein n=1 Tax=Giardia muris TaxID=5742 RepID=A0A4Z1T3B9_GIAMU|nr:Membrane protein [Giardia muris]|eukprot:TNJ30148.1 Membrane protein [Giardia muris]
MKRILCSRNLWLSILLGQVCAVLNSASGVFNDLLAEHEISLPFFQSVLMYGSMLFLWALPCVHSIFVHRPRDVLFFLLSGIFDVGGNVLAIIAFSYTSVASVLLLLCLSTPFCLVCSYLILRRKFSWIQILCALLATVFAAVFVVIDVGVNELVTGSKLVGDLIAIGSAFLYAITSVVNEFIVTAYTPWQFLARMSISATSFALILMCFLDADRISTSLSGNWVCGLYILGYCVSLLGMYFTIPVVISLSSAVVFNISLITCNLYGMIASLVIFRETYSPWVALPLIGIAASLAGYFLTPESTTCCRHTQAMTCEELNGQGGRTDELVGSVTSSVLITDQTGP